MMFVHHEKPILSDILRPKPFCKITGGILLFLVEGTSSDITKAKWNLVTTDLMGSFSLFLSFWSEFDSSLVDSAKPECNKCPVSFNGNLEPVPWFS